MLKIEKGKPRILLYPIKTGLAIYYESLTNRIVRCIYDKLKCKKQTPTMSLKSLAGWQLLKSGIFENIGIKYMKNICIGASDTVRFCILSFHVLDNSTLVTDQKH